MTGTEDPVDGREATLPRGPGRLPSGSARSRRVRAVTGLALLLPSLVLAGLLLTRALRDVDVAWDTWGYHLPFAARLAGLSDRSGYELADYLEARYDGFPLLAERLQGLLWRATGRIQSANLLSLGSLFAFWAFLRLRFGVPLWTSVPALLAVPLVQIHATTCYVDLPVGVAIAIAILSTYRVWAGGGGATLGDLALVAAGVGFAANAKHLAVPVGGLIWVAFGGLELARRSPDRGRLLRVFFWIALTPLLFASQLVNAARFGNPAYPVKLSIGGQVLPYFESRGDGDEVAPWWRPIPRPVRFALSVLEVRAYDDTRPRPWVIDMGYVRPGSTSDRIGGFFFLNVALFGGALLVAARRLGRKGRLALLLFGATTAVAAVQPQAHELRYSMYWILTLIGLAAHLTVRRGRELGSRRPLVLLTLGAWGSLAIVLFATRGHYLESRGRSLERVLAHGVEPDRLRALSEPPGACLVGAQPNTFRYAPIFHPGLDYRLKEALNADECGELRVVDARR